LQESELRGCAVLYGGGEKLGDQYQAEENYHHQLADAFLLEQAVEQRFYAGGQE
jgi:hypothetical protein